MADLEVQNEGSIFIVWPRSPEGQLWCDDHLPEDAQRWGYNGVNGIVVEHRYIADIVEGAKADGLEVA